MALSSNEKATRQIGYNGMLLESFLADGRQSADEPLQYGVSITDPCIGWARTETLLRELHGQL